jgi:subtilisin family serine protease
MADSFDIVAALDRLAARGVPIVNLSFAGPANRLLERAGAEATRGGMLIVAAAGNDGPSSPPRYPAAYDWAVAVTAVDRRDNVYVRAVRGPHIAFAAPGVRIQLPDRALRPGPLRSGTSYAAPLVTAALSVRRATATPSSNVVAALAADATDIGAPGRDPVFGWGLIDTRKACPSY